MAHLQDIVLLEIYNGIDEWTQNRINEVHWTSVSITADQD